MRIVTADGMVTGMPLWLLYTDSLPPSPASAGDFMEWLDSAFGPAGGNPVSESWYDHILEASFNESRQSIEIRTDLDFNSPADHELADVIAQVVTLAAPGGVTNWIVLFDDAAMELSGGF